MPDTILDDVKTLLLKEKGDKHILEQIRRAAQNNEAISVYERNYVAKLRAEFLERRDPAPRSSPRVSSPSSPPSWAVNNGRQPAAVATNPSPAYRPGSSPSDRSSGYGAASVTPSKSMVAPVALKGRRAANRGKTKILIAAVLATVVAAAAAAGAYTMMYGSDGSDPWSGTSTTTSWDASLPISVDEESYSAGGIISVAGMLDDPSDGGRGIVTLFIENPDGTVVWTEDVAMRPDGMFSTLLIAGGPGWDSSGEYSLVMMHDGQNAGDASFAFET